MLSMGKSTISVAIFHSYVCLPEGKLVYNPNHGEITTMFTLVEIVVIDQLGYLGSPTF